MNFQYNYNLRGSNRKPLVEAICQILDKSAVYQGAPSFSYIIGDYTVDRNGVLSHGSNIHPDFAAVLISDLQERGFEAERVAIDNMAEASDADENVPGADAQREDVNAQADIIPGSNGAAAAGTTSQRPATHVSVDIRL